MVMKMPIAIGCILLLILSVFITGCFGSDEKKIDEYDDVRTEVYGYTVQSFILKNGDTVKWDWSSDIDLTFHVERINGVVVYSGPTATSHKDSYTNNDEVATFKIVWGSFDKKYQLTIHLELWGVKDGSKFL